MKVALLVLAALPAFAASNAVILQEQSGSPQTNRVVTIPRYFADKEICLNPRPYSGGAAIAFWQADVKTRWPADARCATGYAKFALVTVELPSLAAAGLASVEFRSDAAVSSGGAGLAKAQMLALSWGAKITARVATLSASGSARAMVASDHYKVLESGPVRTSVLVREGPDAISAATTRTTGLGFQCTAGCVAPYDAATWNDNPAYYSMRPSFVVTFYTPHAGAPSVEIDYLLDNGWLDRAQDQRIDSMVLASDAAETAACYTAPAAFVLPFRGRFFESCWVNQPGAINIDFGRAYVTYSKVLPAYGLNWTIGASAIALEMGSGASTSCLQTTCSFTNSDQGATTNATITPHMGWGQDADLGGATGGGSPVLGFLPRWDARYVVSGFDSRLMPAVLGNAKAYMHAPLFALENSVLGFGKLVSIDARPTFQSYIGNGTSLADAPRSAAGSVPCQSGVAGSCPSGITTCAAPKCMITCTPVGGLNFCSSYATNTVNNWRQDDAHARGEGIAAYLFTGKQVYLELVQALASWAILSGANAGDPPSVPLSRYGKRGIIYTPGNTIRGTAWPIRNYGAAALFSPDGSAEQQYYLEKLNNNLESNEGRHDIRNGSFPPANPSCAGFNKSTETSIWRMARCFDEGGRSNPLFASLEHDATLGNLCEGCDASLESDGGSPWMEQYWVHVLGWLTDVGFRAASLHEAQAKRAMHQFGDSAYLSVPAAGPAEAIAYRIPVMAGSAVKGNRTGYIQTWKEVRAAVINSVLLAKAAGPTDTSIFAVHLGDSNGAYPNQLDLQLRLGSYFKWENEFVQLTAAANVAATVASVDASADSMTFTAPHGFVDGQRVLATGSPVDGGLIGNPLCMVFAGGRNNFCGVWVHVLDPNTITLFNDEALTSKVNLTGGGAGQILYQSRWTVARGALGSVMANHAAGSTIQYWPIVTPPSRASLPDAHAFFYTTALATAMDHDYTITDSNTGQTLTARRVFDIVDQTVQRQNIAGANVASCVALSLSVLNCDEPRWGIRPRPLIRNVRVVPGASSAQIHYSAPDGNGCKVGVSALGFDSTDDTGDAADGQKNLGRSWTASGLTPGTAYQYRITCGPQGSARVMGSFATK